MLDIAPRIPQSKWMLHGTLLADMLGTKVPEEQLAKISCLTGACRTVLRKQPSLVRVAQPCKVFGDVHGQLRDLLLLFREYGFPMHVGGDVEICNYVFNGDYVDRGAHQLEVVLLVFALKVMYPSRVFLLRGNHEFRSASLNMGSVGFAAACVVRMGNTWWEAVFEAVHRTFEWLPLGAVIASRILVVHGGLGAFNSDLSQTCLFYLVEFVLGSLPKCHSHTNCAGSLNHSNLLQEMGLSQRQRAPLSCIYIS